METFFPVNLLANFYCLVLMKLNLEQQQKQTFVRNTKNYSTHKQKTKHGFGRLECHLAWK